MTSIAPIAQDQQFQNESSAAEDLVNAHNLDSQFTSFKARFNDLLTALETTIRDDDTLTDSIVRLRNFHPEVLLAMASAAGWQPKLGVRVATTANGTFATAFDDGSVIDGVTLAEDDRILIKDQTDQTQNGIYIVSSSGVPIRATDADTADEIGHAYVIVGSEGTANKFTTWVLSQAAEDITLETTDLDFMNVGAPGVIPVAQGGTGEITAAAARANLGPWDDALVTATGTVTARSLGARGIDKINVLDFGADRTGVTDCTSQIQAAINYAETLEGGGRVELPDGVYAHAGVTVPAYVSLSGTGSQSTIMEYTGMGIAVDMGGTGTSVYFGCGVENMTIRLMTHGNNISATAVKMSGVVGGFARDLYIEGDPDPLYLATRATSGVVIDPRGVSSYFNEIRNVYSNHIHHNFVIDTSGGNEGTQQQFINCSAFGDKDAGDTDSVGLLVGGGQGNGAIWIGGNFENLGQGIYLSSDARSMTFTGARVENNTYDIYINANVLPQTFIGLCNLDQAKIFDASSLHTVRHTYIGCHDSNAALNYDSPYNQLPGTTNFKAAGNAATPLIVTAYVGQTVPVMKVKDSSGTVLSGINENLDPFGNSFKFPSTAVPSSNANTLDAYKEADSFPAAPVIGGSTSQTGQTYAASGQVSKYTKIGNIVTATCYLAFNGSGSAKGTIVGNIVVRNLPFGSKNTSGILWTAKPYLESFASRVTDAIIVLVGNSTNGELYIKGPKLLTGTMTCTTGGAVSGSSTLFTTEVTVGDHVVIGGFYATVLSITDNVTMAVTDIPAAASGTAYNESKMYAYRAATTDDLGNSSVIGFTIVYHSDT